MKSSISKFELLIIKDLEGELDLDEKIQLEEFLQESSNQKLYKEQKELWESIDDLKKMKSINKKKALRKIEAQLFGRYSTRIFHELGRVAAVLFMPLFLVTAWLFYEYHATDNLESPLVFNTVEIPSGTKSKLNLADGTVVWLNAGSSLSYPVSFDGNIRKVELNGEAFFEVTKNKDHPFVVSAGELNIKVLGTKFNCRAYAESTTIETALIEGSVELSGEKGKNKFVMNPGELAVFTKDENTLEKSHTDLEKYVAWKSGKLMFRDDPLERVIEKLGKWYGVQFQIEDQSLIKYTYSATFSTESLDQVLKMLTISAPINFEFISEENRDDNNPKIIVVTRK